MELWTVLTVLMRRIVEVSNVFTGHPYLSALNPEAITGTIVYQGQSTIVDIMAFKKK